MGRSNTCELQSDHGARKTDAKLRLAEVSLTQGYDSGGAYWGDRRIGETLYRAWTNDGKLEMFIDATCRQDAKNKVRKTYPQAVFFK
jgi:hypothetical protein